jgi:hypothetical protein
MHQQDHGPGRHDFLAKFLRDEHNAAQDRVKSRAIATAGQNTNPRFIFARPESAPKVFAS